MAVSIDGPEMTASPPAPSSASKGIKTGWEVSAKFGSTWYTSDTLFEERSVADAAALLLEKRGADETDVRMATRAE